MKRDMNIIRRIVLDTAELPFGQMLVGIDDTEAAVFSLHAIWLKEAGLITANIQEYASGEPATVQIRRLTWAGCEFADAVLNDTLWKKAQQEIFKPGISFTFEVLKEWLKTEITQGFPTLR